MELLGSCFDVVLILSLGILVLELLRKYCDVGPYQTLLVTVFGLSVCSYKIIHRVWLPQLYLPQLNLGRG